MKTDRQADVDEYTKRKMKKTMRAGNASFAARSTSGPPPAAAVKPSAAENDGAGSNKPAALPNASADARLGAARKRRKQKEQKKAKKAAAPSTSETVEFKVSVEKRKQRKRGLELRNSNRSKAAEKEAQEEDEGEEEKPSLPMIMLPPGAFEMPGSQTNLGEDEDSIRSSGKLPEALVVTSARVYDSDDDKPPRNDVTLVHAERMKEQEAAAAVNFQDPKVRTILCCVLVGVIILVVALSVALSGGDSGSGKISSNATGSDADAVLPTMPPTPAPSANPTAQPTSLSWFLQRTIRDGMDVEFGYALELSGQGNDLIVGTRFGGNNRSGLVRVYARNEDADTWEPRGLAIIGNNTFDQLGYSVSISDSGDTIAVGTRGRNNAGRATVYQYSEFRRNWDEVGSSIEGTLSDGDVHKVSLSGDGKYLAVVTEGGYPTLPSVVLYVLENDEWVATDTFTTSSTFENAPIVVISKDGVGYVAVGNAWEDTYRSKGTVRVYRYVQAERRWTQLGSTLEGTYEGQEFGQSLSFTENLHLAVGSPSYGEFKQGAVEVFHYDESLDSWIRVGKDLFGIREDEFFGGALSLSADGQRFIAASSVWGSNSQGIEGIGVVRAFQYSVILEEWQQVGEDLEAEVGGEEFGFALSMSADGGRIAISAPDQSNDSVGTGYVKVYELESIRQKSRILSEFPPGVRRHLQD